MYNFKGQPNINSLLKQHSLMVKRIAHHMYAKLPASVEVDDLIQVGMMGLADAISKYDSQHGAQFETYANQRIRGAILDELRSTDWMSRTSRKEQKIIEKAIQKAEQQLGRDPGEQDIANEMGISISAYQEMLFKSRGTQLLYLEDLTGEVNGDEEFLDRYVSDSESDPFHMLENQNMRQSLIDAIGLLPEREQNIMSMYYEQEMNLKEMAEVLGITDSRVSQLHSQAIARLRQKLKSS